MSGIQQGAVPDSDTNFAFLNCFQNTGISGNVSWTNTFAVLDNH